MRLAIDAVKDGQASAAISAGNTGALMALAKFALKTLPGIERPAIATLMPTRRSEAVVLDLGANTECDAANLVQFAVMGEVFARAVLGFAKPTVGLLNIGTEEVKGHDTLREAAALLRASELPIEFRGFVEGSDLTSGKVDVVVTDGFTGNVALKVAEGTVALYSQCLREAFKSSLMAKLGYYLARPALQLARQRLDPRRYNGAMFLGLNGIVVKSHGGTDALGFANAIGSRSTSCSRAPTSASPPSCASSSKRPCAPARGLLTRAAGDDPRAGDRQRRLSAGAGGQQRRARAHGRHQRRLDLERPGSASATSRPRAS